MLESIVGFLISFYVSKRYKRIGFVIEKGLATQLVARLSSILYKL